MYRYSWISLIITVIAVTHEGVMRPVDITCERSRRFYRGTPCTVSHERSSFSLKTFPSANTARTFVFLTSKR
ncbi:hypothetical protein IW261DRAFT_1163187 [Armillaria novae-zelandiae]|uniref:Secreted protein n=1 Tax=Armillaria novae-zelandiae TaxID=153914 RepID=A0AA39NFR5_9AGAR|nr:hypothetical protein IW261DRAFT_1163187 [Armillaria novae-zelandiae]